MADETMSIPAEALRRKPQHLEIEDIRKSASRRPWIFVFLLMLIVLCLLLVLLVQVGKSPPVIVFDGAGKPILFQDTEAPKKSLEVVRVEHFAKTFFTLFERCESGLTDKDWQQALSMCSFEYQDILTANKGEMARRKAFREKKDVETLWGEIKVEVAKFDPMNSEEKIKVRILGRRAFVHRYAETHEGAVWEYFVSYLYISRVPVREVQPYGLAVEMVRTEYFETPQEFRAYLLRSKQR